MFVEIVHTRAPPPAAHIGTKDPTREVERLKMSLNILGPVVTFPTSRANGGFLLEGRDSRTYVTPYTMCVIPKDFLTCVSPGPELPPELGFSPCPADMKGRCDNPIRIGCGDEGSG